MTILRISILLFSFLLLSCSSSEENIDIENLESFWDDFLEAVEDNDSAGVAELSIFPMGKTLVDKERKISREIFFRDYYPGLFRDPDWREMLLDATVDDLAPEGDGRILYLITEDASENEIYESGWILFFKRLDDASYRLAAMSLAGEDVKE